MKHWKEGLFITSVVALFLGMLAISASPTSVAYAGDNPTKTPQPTHTPKPTATEKPTKTPKPTETQHIEVTICHWDNGHGGEYQTITVDDDGSYSGHIHHANDLIPAPEGGCPVQATATPEPTATQIPPTATDLPQPTAEPTDEVTPEPTDEVTPEPTETETPSCEELENCETPAPTDSPTSEPTLPPQRPPDEPESLPSAGYTTAPDVISGEAWLVGESTWAAHNQKGLQAADWWMLWIGKEFYFQGAWYTVTDYIIADPSEVALIDGGEDITLITCRNYDPVTNTWSQRLVIYAELSD